MITGYLFAVVLAALLLALLFVLLRTRRIREKYVGVWIVVAVAVLVMAVFPSVAFWLTDLVGVQTPVNLLFAVGSAVLLAVCIQLSSEVSSLEDETRTIAEELALLRLEMRTRSTREATAQGTPPPATGPASAPPVDGSVAHPDAPEPGDTPPDAPSPPPGRPGAGPRRTSG